MITPEVLYEDNHLLILNKKAGTLVQGDATGDEPLVEIAKQYVGAKYDKPGRVFMGVVHRLDRPVSGVVVFARTSKALQRMNALFREKATTKTYYAITSQKPPYEGGTLVHWLQKDEQKNKTTAFSKETDGALRSELSFGIIASKHNLYLLEVKPITGRPHQIRVQLASIGCPIKGDLKYGDKGANADGSICLHARQLEFIHPVRKEPLLVKAPVPEMHPWSVFEIK